MALTDTRIRNLKPKERPYKVADGGGLYIEVKPTGAKLWRLRYRHISPDKEKKGKRTETIFAIGTYPDVNLSTARAERDGIKRLLKKGIHPARQRKQDKIRQENELANTFRAVAREWLDRNTGKWTPATLKQRRNALEAEVYPYIGDLPVSQVTPHDVLDILQRVEMKAPTMAVIIKQAIGAICRHAITTLRAEVDPTAPLRNVLKPRQVEHSKPLHLSEIPKFLNALEDESFTVRMALRLMLLTLARTNELLRARWTEFDLDTATWTIPAERMKMRSAHRVPLPTQAVELLQRLHALSGSGEYLFPNRSDRKRHVSPGVLWKAVTRMGYAGQFTPHGIRATASTILNEMGYRPDVIEAQLAHAERNKTRKAYNRADYLDERREMIRAWADCLDALKSGEGKVVPLKRGTA